MGSGGLGCCGSLMTCLLFIFNICFFISGAAILGVAIWLKVDDNVSDYLQIIEWDEGNETLSAASTVLIVTGAIIFFVGFLGCCGAQKENTCMLSTYAALMILIVLLEVTGGILAIVFSAQVTDTLQKSMSRQTKNAFLADADGGDKDPLTLAWKSLQVDVKCCGGYNYTDYANSTYSNFTTEPIPETCCVLNTTRDYITKPEVQDRTKCIAEADGTSAEPFTELHNKGCYQGLVDEIKAMSGILIGVGLGLAALQIFGIVFACCVKNEINKGR